MKYLLFTDGGSRGNPGKSAAGVVLKSEDGICVAQDKKTLGIKTNNEAEYLALIFGIGLALKQGATQLDIYMDSTLVVQQVLGKFKINHDHLRTLNKQVQELLLRLQKYSISYVPRAQNALADSLVNMALDNEK